MPLRKIAKTIDAALRDADRARKVARDPSFRRDVQTDRRGTLRTFETVEPALEDRATAERARRARVVKPKRT